MYVCMCLCACLCMCACMCVCAFTPMSFRSTVLVGEVGCEPMAEPDQGYVGEVRCSAWCVWCVCKLGLRLVSGAVSAMFVFVVCVHRVHRVRRIYST